jgi:prepilin-type N-terminal cleavage/methylation domain-containing protein
LALYKSQPLFFQNQDNYKTMNKDNRQGGFTLIELSIVILISGVLMAGAIAMLQPYLKYTQRDATNKKITVISDALATFAQTYGRLPCPADPAPATEPFGAPRNSGPAGSDISKNDCDAAGSDPKKYIGIVPFVALGLSEENARDGYGRYFTYAVNPAMTKFDTTTGAADLDPKSDVGLTSDCTNKTWKDSATGNKNVYKAHVCCPSPVPAPLAIKLTDGAGAQANDLFAPNAAAVNVQQAGPGQWQTYADAQALGTQYDDPSKYEYGGNCVTVSDCGSEDGACAYGDQGACQQAAQCHTLNAPPPNTWQDSVTVTGNNAYGTTSDLKYCDQRRLLIGAVAIPYQSQNFVAYVVISHGMDGDGAFLKGGGTAPPTVSLNAQEVENHNDDLNFVDRPISTSLDDNYFDDIVHWETNDHLISHFGNNSCSRP